MLTPLSQNLSFFVLVVTAMPATRLRYGPNPCGAFITRRPIHPCRSVPEGSNDTEEGDKDRSDELHERITKE